MTPVGTTVVAPGVRHTGLQIPKPSTQVYKRLLPFAVLISRDFTTILSSFKSALLPGQDRATHLEPG